MFSLISSLPLPLAAAHPTKKHSLFGYEINVEIKSSSLSIHPVPVYCVATGQSWLEGVLPSGQALGAPSLMAQAWLCFTTLWQWASLSALISQMGYQQLHHSSVTIK